MAIQYNLEDCNFNSDDPNEWSKLRSVAFGTVHTGIPYLKDEAEARRFYLRYSALYYVQHQEPFVSWEWVRDNMIGLVTNASRKTERQFALQLGTLALDHANVQLQQNPPRSLHSV